MDRQGIPAVHPAAFLYEPLQFLLKPVLGRKSRKVIRADMAAVFIMECVAQDSGKVP